MSEDGQVASKVGVRQPQDGPRRVLTGSLVSLSLAVAAVGTLVGGLLLVLSLTGTAFGAWASAEAITPGLIGAAMLGVAPGLVVAAATQVWEQARALLYPVAVVLAGLLAVSVFNGSSLHVAAGGSVIEVGFSIGWVVVLGLLALLLAGSMVMQSFESGTPKAGRVLPLLAWSKPLLALLGSAWFGIGAGLFAMPSFWADFVPWTVNETDAQASGIVALALGVGVLFALAEDDLARTLPALLGVLGIAVASAVVLAVHAPAVAWSSGAGFALIAMVAGLLLSAIVGLRLLRVGGTSRD